MSQSRYSSAFAEIQSKVAGLNRQNARQQLAAEIEDATHHLRSLISLNNTLSPIFDLPDEIWLHIARLIQLSTTRTWSGRGATLRTNFLPLTHTCQYFRNLFTSASQLWAYIDPDCSRMTDLCLKRSKDSPLALFLEYDHQWNVYDSRAPVRRRYISDVYQYTNVIPRVDTLEIFASHHDMATVATITHSLDIHVFRSLKLGSGHVPSFRKALTPLITGSHRLIHPFLVSTPSNRTSAVLETLDLSSNPGEIIPDIQSFYAILQACPLLSYLCLNRVVPTAPSSVIEGLKPVLLPRLRRIFIRDIWEVVEAILQLIDCPGLVETELITTSVGKRPMLDLPVVTRMRQCPKREIIRYGPHLVAKGDWPFKHSVVIEEDISRPSTPELFHPQVCQLGKIVGGNECTDLVVGQRTKQPEFNLSVALFGPRQVADTEAAWSTIYDMFPGVEVLRLEGLQVNLDVAIKGLSGKLPRLASVEVWDGKEFLEKLSPFSDRPWLNIKLVESEEVDELQEISQSGRASPSLESDGSSSMY